MIKTKLLSEYDLKDYQITYDGKQYDMKIGVCGIFDSLKVHWQYYAISYIKSSNRLCADLCTNQMVHSTMSNDVGNIRSYYRKFDTQQEAEGFLKDFKVKWDNASNNSSQVIRDEKLNEILDVDKN